MLKKITILSLHLGYGGIEKCVTSLANNLCDNYDVEIISTYKLFDKSFYELNDKVKVKYLTEGINPNLIKEEFRNTKNIFKKIILGIKSINILKLKKRVNIDAIKNCDSDYLISTRDYFNFLVGKYFNGTKIAWEHNHHNNNMKYINNLTNSVKNIDKLVLVSQNLKEYYKKYFIEHNIKCECIYIPNFLDEIPSKVSNLSSNNLISVGRLEQVKGYSDLLDVMKMLNSDIHLDIIGDGSLYNKLEDKIKDNNLNVKLHGYKNKDYINNYYLNSSIYLMSSLTESFGLVLIEAMSYGIPCISFNSAEGANDIIKDNYNGYLIDNRNKKEMADKINLLLKDRKLLNKLSEGARETALKYKKDEIIKIWRNIL